MVDAPQVLFIQKRPHRAGAQTSLDRIAAVTMEVRPAALVGGEGWLTRHLREQGVPVLVADFPSPRSLPARLWGLKGFVRKATAMLAEAEVAPKLLIANDHQECPLALALAEALGGVPVLGILRSAAMSARDFDKYHCLRCDGLLAVGEKLQERVASWGARQPEVLREGFAEIDFHPPMALAERFPERLLVLGTASPAKGFSDFIEALDLIEARHPEFPSLHCDFTSETPPDMDNLLRKPRRAQLRFPGRSEEFTALVRSYSLAVHPSRAETFGMAPIEAILAGVPTLASSTGAVANIPFPADWQFPPSDPPAIAERLITLWRNWPNTGLDLALLQQEIRRNHHIDQTLEPLRREFRRLGCP